MVGIGESRAVLRGWTSARRPVLALLFVAMICAGSTPVVAQAHGPTAPVATSYLARIDRTPAGVQAKVIDGYLRMWMRVAPTRSGHGRGPTVVVLDYRGAPYLRFAPSGVYVNKRSEMYYLNHFPAEPAPADLTRQTPPRWQRVSDGHEYGWHDARIGALADTAIPPGASYVGRWQVALLVNGRLSAVTGGLWHAPDPSLAWMWLIVVVIACVLAAWRVRRHELHARLARALAIVLLIAIAIGIAGRELHGRPYVSAEQLVIAVPTLAFVAWGMFRVLTGRAGWIFDLLTAFIAVWVGSELWPTLLHGFVLTAIPPLLARVTAVVCLGGGVGLLLLVMRKARHAALRAASPASAAVAIVLVLMLVLSGCGGEAQTARTGQGGRGGQVARRGQVAPAGRTAQAGQGAGRGQAASMRPPPSSQTIIPAALLRQARPIGRGPRFHPPASGPVPGPCTPTLGARTYAHVEVFAANRVVIVPAGIGVGAPWRMVDGRVRAARCYGALVSLEPTGVVLVRRGLRLTLTDLFRAWGQPLAPRRVASFTAPAAGGGSVVFVDGHRRYGAPGAVPLSPRAEIVIEIGPRVPPHASYAFGP